MPTYKEKLTKFTETLTELPKDIQDRRSWTDITGLLYKDVDGVLHKACKNGEPEYAVSIDNKPITTKTIDKQKA